MDESILNSIKKMLGIDPDYTRFDTDIIMYINMVISSLIQIGIDNYGFYVYSADDLWSDYAMDEQLCSMLKIYIYLKVKNMFDPPASSFVTDAMNEQAKELEWRINFMHEQSIAEESEEENERE